MNSQDVLKLISQWIKQEKNVSRQLIKYNIQIPTIDMKQLILISQENTNNNKLLLLFKLVKFDTTIFCKDLDSAKL